MNKEIKKMKGFGVVRPWCNEYGITEEIELVKVGSDKDELEKNKAVFDVVVPIEVKINKDDILKELNN